MDTTQDIPAINDRVLRIRDMMKLLGICRHSVARWEAVGALPPRRVFGPGLKGWLESEIATWFKTRPTIAKKAMH